MTPTRQFPTPTEIDHLVDLLEAAAPTMATALTADGSLDQLKAAQDEIFNRFSSAAPGLVTSGDFVYAVAGISRKSASDRAMYAAALRQFIAAMSAGVEHFCTHTKLLRPIMLVCDPPVMVCFECVNIPGTMEAIAALGHYWDYQCDRCGQHVELLSHTVLSGLGNVSMSGHICRDCREHDERWMAASVDAVRIVPPKQTPFHKP